MPFTVCAFDHKAWEENSLADYGEFSDYVGECNQQEWADHTTGEWFYIPDEKLPPMKGVDYEGKEPNERVIYFGSWGNDNSPGASSYTYAEIFDMDTEAAEFEARKAEWEAKPEWLGSESEEEKCERCGSVLDEEGRCTDETCPFSDHDQDCPAGWEGHPEIPSDDCECGLEDED